DPPPPRPPPRPRAHGSAPAAPPTRPRSSPPSRTRLPPRPPGGRPRRARRDRRPRRPCAGLLAPRRPPPPRSPRPRSPPRRPAPRSFRPRDPTPRSSAPVEVPTALRVLHRTAEQHPPYLSTTSRRWISLRGGVLPAWIPSALVGWDARFCGGRRAGFHGQGREARCRRGPDGDGDVHVDGGLVSAHPHRRLLGNGLRHVLAYSVEGLAPSRGAGAAPGRVRARELDGRGLQAPQRDRGDQDERGERHGDLRRGRPPIPQPARLRAFSMICKSSCFTWELVTILKSRP